MIDANAPDILRVPAPKAPEPVLTPKTPTFTPIDHLISSSGKPSPNMVVLAGAVQTADNQALESVRQRIGEQIPLSPEQIQASLPVFLKTVYNVNFQDLHPETVNAITTLIDKPEISQQELDAGIADIMSSVKNDLSQQGKLTQDQVRHFDGLDSAIRSGVIKPTQLFEQARDLIPSLESLSAEQRTMVEGLGQEMEELGDAPDKGRVKTVAQKTAKVGKVLGIGGIVMLGLMVWRAMGEE